MSRENVFYRMNTLMSYTEIDAFTAQKNIGSRLAYFEALENYVEATPESARILESLSPNDLKPEFLEFITNLQNELMKIGASALVWEAERIAVSAREEEYGRCAGDAALLAAKLRLLQEKILEAKVEKQPEDERKATETISFEDNERKNRPQGNLRIEQCEKLLVLIENFELDDALSLIRSLLDYSYGKDIDVALVAIFNRLATFDYDGAIRNLHRLLQTIQIIENNKQKGSAKKILAIDDVPDVLTTVKSVLGKRYTVYGVTNHKAALKFLTANHADLILLDIEMPDMNGFAMLGIIRRIRAYENTPVLFLTGSVSIENIRRSHDLGANDFIRKPIEADVLISKIEKHI